MDSTAVIVYVLMAGIIGWTMVSAVIHIKKGECKLRNKHHREGGPSKT